MRPSRVFAFCTRSARMLAACRRQTARWSTPATCPPPWAFRCRKGSPGRRWAPSCPARRAPKRGGWGRTAAPAVHSLTHSPDIWPSEPMSAPFSSAAAADIGLSVPCPIRLLIGHGTSIITTSSDPSGRCYDELHVQIPDSLEFAFPSHEFLEDDARPLCRSLCPIHETPHSRFR